jgi:hypothetical protein
MLKISSKDLLWLFYGVFVCMMAMAGADLLTSLKHISHEMEGGDGSYRSLYYMTFLSIWGAVGYLLLKKWGMLWKPLPVISVLFACWMIINLLLLVGVYPLGIRKVFTWLGGLLFFYLYVDGDLKKLKQVAFFMTCAIVPLGIVANVFVQRTAQMKGEEFVVINQVYNVLPLLPWCFVFRSRLIQLVVAVGMAGIVGISAKRGAFIAFSLMMFAMLMTSALVRGRLLSAIMRGIQMFIVGVFGLGVLLFVDHSRGGAIYYRVMNIGVDKGTGRLDIYYIIIENIKNFSAAEMLMGAGYYSSAMTTGKSGAHNDWLEVMHDFGLIGLLLFTLINLSLIVYWYRLVRAKNDLAVPLIGFYVLFFGLTMYSIILSAGYFIFITAAWGALYSFRDRLYANPSRIRHPVNF